MDDTKTIDCLLIGHNEMDFARYEKTIRKMGLNSGAYRDLNMNFIRFNNRPYSLSEVFNIFHYQDSTTDPFGFFHVGESFSAAIAYLGTYLNKHGYTFDYVNSSHYSKDQLSKKLSQENILTIAITTTLYVSVLPILEIMEFIRTYNRTAKIIIGGPFVSTSVRVLAPQDLEREFSSIIGADFYINSSQGEATLCKIIHALKNQLHLDCIPNLFYKTGKGFLSTPPGKENNRLSENMVNWDLFNGTPGEYVNVRTSISCPFSCSFCGFPQHAGKYQTAGVEEIEKELQGLQKIKTVKSLHFIDDTFNVPVERFKEILRMMIKNKFSFKWHSYFRCQFADREMVELMKESGCEGVFLGIESGNNKILENMNKTADISKYLRGIELLNKVGITTFGNFIIGFPGETENTVRDTIEFIKNSGLDFFRTQLWYCEPITPVWNQRNFYGISDANFQWSHSTMNSTQACDLVEEIFTAILQPTWVPQYNFDFDGLWHLTNRGLSIDRVKKFLNSFNNGVKEKLSSSFRKEASYEVLMQIKDSCSSTPGASSAESKNTLPEEEAAFEFL
jgi:radical SAM PhpK family P-methyltransferase